MQNNHQQLLLPIGTGRGGAKNSMITLVGAEDEHVFKFLGLKELIIKMQKTSMFAISKYGISGANTD